MIHCSSVRAAGLFFLLSTLLFACHLPPEEIIVTVNDPVAEHPPNVELHDDPAPNDNNVDSPGDEPDELDDADKPDELDDTDKPDELDDTDETDELNNTDDLDDTDGTDELDDTDGTDELGDTDGTDELDDTDETDELDDTDETDELDDTDETDELDDTDETDELDGTDEADDKPADDGSDAKVANSSYPAKIQCGKTKTVSVTMKNVGTTTWKPKTHRLVPLSASPLFIDQNSIPLSKGTKVKPNQTVKWVFDLVGPPQKGTHLLRWRMQSGDLLFGKAAKMTIKVHCTKPPLYPPAIEPDFSNVVWMLENKGEDISDWPETVSLKASKGPGNSINIKNNATTCGPGDVCWPTFNPNYVKPEHMFYNKFVGSAWIFVYQEDLGMWVAGVFESIVRPQQQIQDHNFYEHLKFPGGKLQWFEPQSGERYGWMISSATIKAGTKYTVNERSNVSEFVWP